jgi:hypothetical protein
MQKVFVRVPVIKPWLRLEFHITPYYYDIAKRLGYPPVPMN